MPTTPVYTCAGLRLGSMIITLRKLHTVFISFQQILKNNMYVDDSVLCHRKTVNECQYVLTHTL